MQDLKMQDQIAEVENAGPENAGIRRTVDVRYNEQTRKATIAARVTPPNSLERLVRQRGVHTDAVPACCCHCVMHAEPLQTQVHDDSGDESDRDDSAADTDADTGNSAPADASSYTSDRCEFCLLQPRAGVALVPCGHSRFCATCADTVASMDSGCPICRSPIRIVLRLYQ